MVEILVAILLLPIVALIWSMTLCLVFLMYKSYKKGIPDG